MKDGIQRIEREYEEKNFGQSELVFGDGGERLNKVELSDIEPVKSGVIFDKSEWLTTKEAAVYLRKFEPAGRPSVNAVHKLVARGSIRRRKFSGRLFFRKKELDFLIESSVT